ncbi:hypothetical protein AB1N83_004834 [Pleurotus pulmonarius]
MGSSIDYAQSRDSMIVECKPERLSTRASTTVMIELPELRSESGIMQQQMLQHFDSSKFLVKPMHLKIKNLSSS